MKFSDYIKKQQSKEFLKFVCDNLDKNWDGISSNPNITFEIVEAHPDKPWDWEGLSLNPNITFEIVETYPDKPWNW